MLINIMAAKCIGIEAVPVTVEVDITSGIGVHLVGLADVAVKESSRKENRHQPGSRGHAQERGRL